MKKVLLLVLTLGAGGCASSQGPDVNLVEIANRQFQDQMQQIANQTVTYLKRSSDMIVMNDPESDWLSKLSDDDPIAMPATLGYINGVWAGPFGKLIEDVSERSGYEFIDLLKDSHVTDYPITISGSSNASLIHSLYAGYSNVPNQSFNLIINQKTQQIILRNKCDSSDGCDRLRQLQSGTPRLPNQS